MTFVKYLASDVLLNDMTTILVHNLQVM